MVERPSMDLADADAPGVAARRRAADATRRLIGALVASNAPDVELDRAAIEVDRIAEALAPYAVDTRYAETGGIHFGPAGDNARAFETHPIVGPSHPLAPPLTMERADDVVRATVRYDHRHEGPPGWVHGGVVAMGFDLVLAASGGLCRRPVVTATMTIRLRRPTPLRTDLAFEGRLDRVAGRQVFVHATLHAGSELTADADGICVIVGDGRFRTGDDAP